MTLYKYADWVWVYNFGTTDITGFSFFHTIKRKVGDADSAAVYQWKHTATAGEGAAHEVVETITAEANTLYPVGDYVHDVKVRNTAAAEGYLIEPTTITIAEGVTRALTV